MAEQNISSHSQSLYLIIIDDELRNDPFNRAYSSSSQFFCCLSLSVNLRNNAWNFVSCGILWTERFHSETGKPSSPLNCQFPFKKIVVPTPELHVVQSSARSNKYAIKNPADSKNILKVCSQMTQSQACLWKVVWASAPILFKGCRLSRGCKYGRYGRSSNRTCWLYL